MSLEILEQLELKIQSSIAIIKQLQHQNAELKESNERLKQELESGNLAQKEELEKLRREQLLWQEKIRSLLGKMDSVD